MLFGVLFVVCVELFDVQDQCLHKLKGLAILKKREKEFEGLGEKGIVSLKGSERSCLDKTQTSLLLSNWCGKQGDCKVSSEDKNARPHLSHHKSGNNC